MDTRSTRHERIARLCARSDAILDHRRRIRDDLRALGVYVEDGHLRAAQTGRRAHPVTEESVPLEKLAPYPSSAR